jgi:hypothetical protein
MEISPAMTVYRREEERSFKMSTKTATTATAITEEAFPAQQSVLQPGEGFGSLSLYLADGTHTSLYIFYSGGQNVQVMYGQNGGHPNTPLPTGVSQYPLANGFNIFWNSGNGSPFKLAWGVS